jgi:glutamate formiminotransferase/formiminotetrahydrofolate cyclodeaminase
LRVTGSELVGLIPKEALLAAGRYYLEKQGRSAGVPEEELVRMAALSLGLSDVAPFDPKKKIIEYQFDAGPARLAGMTLREFANELSLDSPAPGGGSVAALCGALSAALSAMVANLTVGKRGYEKSFSELREAAAKAQDLKEECLRAVDLDTAAFNKVMDASRLPKGSPDQQAEREAALEAATREATLVPFRVLELSVDLLRLARTAAEKGNRNSVSDAGVAALAAKTAAEGAYYNIRINLPGLRDEAFRVRIRASADAFRADAGVIAGEVQNFVENGL